MKALKALICALILATLVSEQALSADEPALVGTWIGQRDRIAKVEGRRGGLATLVHHRATGQHLCRAFETRKPDRR